MYIQNYQIQNVLNEYHKRLSQSPGGNGRRRSSTPLVKDSVQLSREGQRQTIIDQVSADIIERSNQYNHGKSFKDKLAAYNNYPEDIRPEKKNHNENEFVYTAIDENNRKWTRTFTIDNGHASIKPSENNKEPDKSINEHPTEGL